MINYIHGADNEKKKEGKEKKISLAKMVKKKKIKVLQNQINERKKKKKN